MIGVPIYLGSSRNMQQVFYGKHVQLFVFAKHTYHVPAETVHIYPATCSPIWPGLLKKRCQCVIVEFSLLYLVLGEIYSGDFTFLLRCQHKHLR